MRSAVTRRPCAARRPAVLVVLRVAAGFLAGSFLGASFLAAKEPLRLDSIELPPGFSIEVWAQVEEARSLARGPLGTIFVGTMRSGRVWAARDEDGDGRAERVVEIARGLAMPNGVAVRDGALYVAEVSRILRYDGIEGRLGNPPAPVVVKDGLPSEQHHGWKYIAFSADGQLYVPVGAPCNICTVEDPYAALLRVDPANGRHEVFARGIRNTVGFDWHPATGELWFTDNGRDMMGDDQPPDELNRAPRAGLHFGFPFCYGRAIADPRFAEQGSCAAAEPAAAELGPHVAALAVRFYRGTMFPERYRGAALIAEHGSWNRSQPIGYRIMVVEVDAAGRTRGYEPLAEGWLQGKRAFGRPVDLLELPDGSLLVSDDLQGVIYRLSYRGAAAPTSAGGKR